MTEQTVVALRAVVDHVAHVGGLEMTISKKMLLAAGSAKTAYSNVTIRVNSSETRDFFLVHSKLLTISSTTLQALQPDDSWQDVALLDTFAYEPNEFWVVRTQASVSPGIFRLSLTFDGSLTANGLVGFYDSDYIDEANNTRLLATTKFEPTYARQAFPCFDEPSFKSTFTVTVVRPLLEYIVLSNMPVVNEAVNQPAEGLAEVTFQESVPMVTYLVCFIVCDFIYIGETLPSGMDFRVYAPRARVDNTEYALRQGAQILQYYEKMFDLPFPLPKSDMAAIPDYVSGATEHWGIITYRETSIFYNPTKSSETNKQRVCSVVAHELAHQWFGNL
ncbi:endoplasmic reticulum aminopeptidase 2-like, partial [Hyalella azteca]|uniref:glutamyl aminopeptidase n=1 Tax=Hyalella azteca TaxID=294128 RepID=A0A8B7PFP0_HYAAZ